MTEQERESIKAVLGAALHNAKVVQDQLRSLWNPKDNSFPDFDMRPVAKEMDEAVKAIEDAIERV